MYKTARQLKTEARQALAGKWGLAVLMTVLTSLVATTFTVPVSENAAVSYGSVVGTALSTIFMVGFYSFLLKLCCGQKDQAALKDIIYGFQCHPGKALLLYLLSVLYILPGSLIYAIVLVIFSFSTIASSGVDLSADLLLSGALPISSGSATTFFIVFLVLTIAFIIYACYIELTYSMVYFLLLDYPDLPVNEIWKRSRQLMKGNRLRLLGIELSFIGWILLSILTLGIGILWVQPYMLATETAFYLDLVQQQAGRNVSVTDITDRHDCDLPHVDHKEADGKNYTGIDQETFR